MQTPRLDHVALVVESATRTARGLTPLGLETGAPATYPGEGTTEIYVGEEGRAARLLLMEPTDPAGPYGRARARRGDGLHHVAIAVESVGGALEAAAHSGWFLHPTSGRTLRQESPVAWLARPGAATLLELFEAHGPATDPRPVVESVEIPLAAGCDGLLDAFGRIPELRTSPDGQAWITLAGRRVRARDLAAGQLACAPLDSRLHLTRVSALAALGEDLWTEGACRAALASGVRAPDLREALLQSYLFLGYPRAINALAGLLHALESPGRDPSSDLAPAPADRRSLDSIRADGEALCRRIYGDVYDALRDRMRRLSSDLDRWMIDEGYGRVLSRGPLSALEREFGVVGALVVLGVLPQLESHLRGALRLGATREDLAAMVGEAVVYARSSAALGARRVLDRVLGSPPGS